MGTVSLLSGKRYGIRVTFEKKAWVLELENPTSTLGLYNYLRFCMQSSHEDSESLWEAISRNTDPLLLRACHGVFPSTVFRILKDQQPELTPDNFSAEVDIRHLNQLLHHVTVGHFASTGHNPKYFIEVAQFITGEIIAAAVKRAESHDPLTIHKLLVEMLQTRAVLSDLDLVDLRVDMSMKFLLNMYKKLFFNQITNILGNLIAQIRTDVTERPADTIVSYPPFVDYYKTIRTFFLELVPLRPIRHFCSITLDLKRKLFYYFFGFFRQTLETSSTPFPYTTLLAMLNGVFYLIRENEQLIADFITTFGNHEPFMKMLLQFKSIFFRVGESVMAKVRAHIRTFVKERFKGVTAEGFDIDQMVKKQLFDVYAPLEKVHTYYRIRIVRLFFVVVLEEFIALVRHEGPDYVANGGFGEAVDKMRDFFSVSFENQTFDNYLKFLEYYQRFLRSKSRGFCETAIAMMKTILSEEISDEFIEMVIRSKDFSELTFRRGEFIDRYEALMNKQKAGEALIQRRQTALKTLGGLLLMGSNCFKFIRIMRRRLIKRKMNDKRDEEPGRAPNAAVREKIVMAQLNKFKKQLQIAFFEPSEFDNVDAEEALTLIKADIMKSPPKTYTLAYESDKLVVMNQDDKLVRIFHIPKFNLIERLEISGYKAVLMTYRQNERVALIVDKVDAQTKLFDKMTQFVELYKQLRFSDQNVYICDMVTALYDTRMLKQMLYRLKFNLSKPDFLPDIDYNCFPHWRYFGFIDLLEFKQSPKPTIKRRKSIDQLFTDENLRLVGDVSHQGSDLVTRMKNSEGPKETHFASFGTNNTWPSRFGFVTFNSDNNHLPPGLVSHATAQTLASTKEALAKGHAPSKSKAPANAAEVKPKGGKDFATKFKNDHKLADIVIDSNYSSNENLYRSNESKEAEVKINPDLLLTLNDQPPSNIKFQTKF